MASDIETLEVTTGDITVNLGPQHPSTHGVFRLILNLQGEVVVDAEPVLGYLHRGFEKLAETRSYPQVIPLTDRSLDYLSSMMMNFAYVLGVEKLADIKVPERAEYLRVIMAELQRIASHLVALGTFATDIGTWFTPLMYMFRARETIVDLFEMTCGARLTYVYYRIGGVGYDIPPEFTPRLKGFLAEMPHRIDEYEDLLSSNEIVLVRTRDVGVLPPATAINYSVSGPNLRACGVPYDVRRAIPYSIYDRFQFDVVTPPQARGDTYDRYWVRLEEMRQSLRIVEQAFRDMPKGAIATPSEGMLRPPPGEVYVPIESSRGEFGYYIVSDGTVKPWRCKVRSPSFINLGVLRELLIGHKVADVVAILGSIDIVLGEVDR